MIAIAKELSVVIPKTIDGLGWDFVSKNEPLASYWPSHLSYCWKGLTPQEGYHATTRRVGDLILSQHLLGLSSKDPANGTLQIRAATWSRIAEQQYLFVCQMLLDLSHLRCLSTQDGCTARLQQMRQRWGREFHESWSEEDSLSMSQDSLLMVLVHLWILLWFQALISLIQWLVMWSHCRR